MSNNCQIYDINNADNIYTLKKIIATKVMSKYGSNKLTINDYIDLIKTTMSGLEIDLNKFEDIKSKSEVVEGVLNTSSAAISSLGIFLPEILIGSVEEATNALRVELNKSLTNNQSKTEVETATDESTISDEDSIIDYIPLNKLYKSKAIINQIQSKFGSDIFRKCFLETNSLSDANTQISDYKIKLFNNIVDYLNKQSIASYDEAETIDDLSSDNYDDVMFEMNDIASNTKARLLSNYYINDPSNPLFVAINNFSSLLYFDDFLKSNYKKIFSKDENGEYSISFGSNLVKGFRTNENVDALKELGSLISVLSSNIPWLFKSGTSFSKIEGRVLDSTKTVLTLNKLLNTLSNVIEYNSLNKELYDALFNFHDNPVENIKIVLSG